MKVIQKSSVVFQRQQVVKNRRWKLPCRRKVRRDYIVGQVFLDYMSRHQEKKKSFHQINIQTLSALKKKICPDKTKSMLHGKQETIVFILARQKKHLVFHKSIQYDVQGYKQILMANFQVNDDCH